MRRWSSSALFSGVRAPSSNWPKPGRVEGVAQGLDAEVAEQRIGFEFEVLISFMYPNRRGSL